MIELAGTLDIECADWDRFLVGATYDGDTARLHRSPAALVGYLREKGGTWWAHCGGRYDFLSIANVLFGEGKHAQVDYPGRISRLVTRGFVLRDSFGLLPFGLERVSELAGTKCPRLPWRCVCGRRCGGYCQLAGQTPETVDPDLESYCVADAKTLYGGLVALGELAAQWKIELCGTIGRSAWETAKRDLRLPDLSYEWPTWERVRHASFGGRDVIARPKARGPGVTYDVSSAYPAALAVASLPVGLPCELGDRAALRALQADEPGIYEATVHVPEDCYLPPLPWRAPQTDRVAYPVGLVRGAWCLPELCAAIERGATVQHVHSAIVWDDEQNLFGAWIARRFADRAKAGKRTAAGEWLRLFCNSLTGKFAESPLRKTIRFHPDSIRICLREKKCKNGCTGRCGAFEPIGESGAIWAQPYFRLGPSAHAHWAVYLRALCRIHWLEGAEASGERELVYAATDSLWTTSTASPGITGSDLGAWEFQHGWEAWECRAKGIYRYKKLSGAPVIRASGVRDLTPGEWRAGIARRKDGVWSLVRAAERGDDLFSRRETEWTLPSSLDRTWYGDRRIGLDGATYPTEVREQLARDLTSAARRGTVGSGGTSRQVRRQAKATRAGVGISKSQTEPTPAF